MLLITEVTKCLHYNASVVIQHVLNNYVLQNPATNDLKKRINIS